MGLTQLFYYSLEFSSEIQKKAAYSCVFPKWQRSFGAVI